MKIHEYQAKALFGAYGIPTPSGSIARTVEEALRTAQGIRKGPFVVKAQIHAGGRGKAGGISVVEAPVLVEAFAAELLGTRLVSAQTGEEGKPVNTVLIEEVVPGTMEIYLGIVINRSKACLVIVTSAQGGVEIERVAAESPEKVMTEDVDPAVGLRMFQANRLAYGLGLAGSVARTMSGIISSLYRLFVEKDCSMAEINPLVVTASGDLIALDGKLTFDDNALFRHPDIVALRDLSQEDPLEVEASRYNLNYIKLKGNVGCMVNGAGLAMATMDLIKQAGAEPANFLDVGGGATSEMVREGFKLLLSDKEVQTIFINIFGGILRCDTLARGVAAGARDLNINMPIIVRLEGTNVEAGRQILGESGVRFTVVSDLKEAAQRVGEAARGLTLP